MKTGDQIIGKYQDLVQRKLKILLLEDPGCSPADRWSNERFLQFVRNIGEIENAKLLDIPEQIEGAKYQVGNVTFVKAADALNLVNHVTIHPLGSRIMLEKEYSMSKASKKECKTPPPL